MNPSLNIIYKDKEEAVIGFKNTNNAIIAAIRRVLMSGIHNSAINEDNIDIIKNNSSYTNDTLKHRISLIPINCSTGTTIELNCINYEDTDMYITSDDLTIIPNNKDKKKQIITKDVIIGILKPKHEIQLVCKVDIKTPQEASTIYSVISTPGFGFMKTVHVKDDESIIKKVKDYLYNIEATVIKDTFGYNDKPTPIGYVSLGLSHDLLSINIKNVCETINIPTDSLIVTRLPNIRTLKYESFLKNPITLFKMAIKTLLKQIRNMLLKNYSRELNFDKETNNYKIEIKINKDDKTSVIAFSNYINDHTGVEMSQYKVDHCDDVFITWVIVWKKEFNLFDIIAESYIKMSTIFKQFSVLK